MFGICLVPLGGNLLYGVGAVGGMGCVHPLPGEVVYKFCISIYWKLWVMRRGWEWGSILNQRKMQGWHLAGSGQDGHMDGVSLNNST